MPKELSRDEFAALPLAEQIKTLGRELKRGDARHLLELSATLRDHAPLSWLSAELLAQGWLNEAANREWFATFLVKEEETAVDKVVKALAAKARETLLAKDRASDRMHADFSATLVASLQVVPIAHLSSLCLLDRALKHNFPEARTKHVADTRALCVEALRKGDLETVTVDRLAHVRAEAIPELREAAEGAGILKEFDAVRKELARRTIDVIGNAPKAVSQANAEELLATRVYTDPGHFLIELLQNAEDSGAKEWKLIFDRDRIAVWHNGTDFDARDVVGVCSIGQTTKRKDQIGQFGVGFKSVYEVTNRPQIFSDVYQFEIADVSIPKLLRDRPKDLPAGGTLLILPLLNPDDPVRSPAAMFKKAQAIDPYVLMTLKSMDVLDFTLTEAGGGPQEHVLTEIHFKDRRQRAIETRSQGGQTGKNKQHYLLEHEPLEWDGPPRPPGRATATELMVGLSTDAEQKPEWHNNPTTVFSFLPTGETSGLHFFIQAHFEVPVDRERVHHDSDWNAWIMGHVPGQLARLTDAVLAGPNPVAGARQLLAVLPVASELVAPIYTNIADQLKVVLADRALIPCADGQLHTPTTALMAKGDLAALFEGRSIAGALIDGSDRVYSFVAADLPERSRDLCEALGCKKFEEKDLVQLLERAATAPAAAQPVFLAEPTADRFSRLAACLLQAVNQNPDAAKRLQPLAIIPDDTGILYAAQPKGKAQAPGRGPDSLRKIYDGYRPFVATALDSMSAGPQPAGHVTDLLDRLQAPRFTTAGLVDDLEKILKPKKGRLASLEDTAFPGNRERLDLILAELVEAPPALQKRARALPLFPVEVGGLARGAKDASDRQGLVHTRAVSHANEMRTFYQGVRPLLAAECEAGPAGRLLVVTEVPAANLELLASDLQAGLFELKTERIGQLHQLLLTVRDSMDHNTRGLFRRLVIWPDQKGDLRPLEGKGAVHVPVSQAIRELLPEAPMLDETIAAMKHVADMGVEKVGVEKVIEALAPDAKPPFVIPTQRDRIEQVQHYLLTSGEKLSTQNRLALAELPVFLDDRQRPRALHDVVLASKEAIRGLYEDTGLRSFLNADSQSMKLAKMLGVNSSVERCDAAMLIKDIDRGFTADQASPLTQGDKRTRAVLQFLSSVSGTIPVLALEKLMKLPLFPDESGSYDTMKSSQAAAGKAGLYTVDAELRPLLRALNLPMLDAALQQSLAPLLKRASISAVQLRTAVDLLESQAVNGAPIRDLKVLAAFHQLLIDQRRELKKHFPAQTRPGLADGNPRLCALKIWPTTTGDVVSADEAVDPGLLLGLLEKGSKEYKELSRRVLAVDAGQRLAELTPMFALCPASRMAQQFVASFAKPGKALRQQPQFLSTPENIRMMATLIGKRKDFAAEEIEQLPVCDARGMLQFGRLATANAETHALLEGQALQADLVHPHFNGFQLPAHGEVFKPLETTTILGAVLAPAFLKKDALRVRFFDWLLSQEHKVLGDPQCRELIQKTPCFLNAGGKFVVPGDLVIDPDLPDLGIDWAPHPDTPKAVLSVLQRQLNIGKPPIDKLIKSHIRAAYDAAARDENAERARELLVYLAKQLRGRSQVEVQKLLPNLPVEDSRGNFRPPAELLQPTAMVESYVTKIWGGKHPRPAAAYPGECLDFLIQLGVNTQPSVEQLLAVFKAGVDSVDVSQGLVGLTMKMSPEDWATLDLPHRKWIADGNGKIRQPQELFSWTIEIQALVGEDKGLYAHGDIRMLLAGAFSEALGFRDASDITLEDVLGRIRLAAETGESVPSLVYQWMERGLNKGLLPPNELLKTLDRRPWICADGAKFFNHRQVLGTRALEFFGERRGYWSEGFRVCPKLCELFDIPSEVTDEMIRDFMEEIGREVKKEGDEAVIKADPAIPRMLLKCAAHLGGQGVRIDAKVPAIVAKAVMAKKKTLRLLSALDPLLFRSETPTLEAQFKAIGKPFYLVETGRSAEDRQRLVAFSDAMGIRRLRDSYTAEVDSKSGQDTTRQSGAQLAMLTKILNAMARVMPRVQKQREHLEESGWVYDKRLKSLGAAGEIRLIRNLSVKMTLKGVGSVSAPEIARYNPKERTLLVEDAALDNLADHSWGLAEGLIPCIYQGNGEDDLVEIVELLLQRSSLASMNKYLDARHFPVVEMEEDPEDALLVRLGEVLDYGIYRKLIGRFPALKDCDFNRWRNPALQAKLVAVTGKTPKAKTTAAANVLLADLGLKSPETELLEAFVTVFTAETLGDIPSEIFVEPRQPQPEVELSEIERPAEPELDQPEPAAEPAEKEKSSWLDSLLGRDKEKPEPPPGVEERRPAFDWEAASIPEPVPEAPEPQPGLGGFSLFDKVAGFFGGNDDDAPQSTGTNGGGFWDRGSSGGSGSGGGGLDWMSGNNLSPTQHIGPQLNVSGDALSQTTTGTAPAGFFYDPAPLPRPYTYGVQVYGATFNARRQEWTPRGVPNLSHLKNLPHSVHTVRMKGVLSPGVSQLPIPMYGRMMGKIRAVDGDDHRIGQLKRRPDGGYEIKITGRKDIHVEFHVELLKVPDLGMGQVGAKLDPALTEPTQALSEMPPAVQQWVREIGRRKLKDNEVAVLAAEFVQKNYCYDFHFKESRSARRAMSSLRKGHGNHHLQIMHAAGDSRYLGRGVCYELNSMVVELLRHLNVPAMVATGWTFKKANVTDPDHLFAVALVKSPMGICPLPLEAATGEGGREMAQNESTQDLGFKPIEREAPPVPESAGAWSAPIHQNEPQDPGRLVAEMKHEELAARKKRCATLVTAVRLACSVLKKREPTKQLEQLATTPTAKLEQEMTRKLESYLGNKRLADHLLALIRGEFKNLHKLPKSVRKLEAMGLAQVEKVELFNAERVRHWH